jgi:hypothetical protein
MVTKTKEFGKCDAYQTLFIGIVLIFEGFSYDDYPRQKYSLCDFAIKIQFSKPSLASWQRSR